MGMSMREVTKVRGVYEREPGSNVWWVRYNDANHRVRREKVGTRRAAVNLYQKRKTEVREGKKLPDNFRKRVVTFAELVTEGLAWSRANKRDWSHDECRLTKVATEFGHRAAESITPRQIEAWIQSNTVTPATANRYRAAISLCYREGLRHQRVTVNPARIVTMKRENNGRIRYLLPEEEQRIRAMMDKTCPEKILTFDFALATGLRSGEQFNIRWADVDMVRGQLTLPMTKNGSVGHVTLSDDAMDVLRRAKETSLGSPYVFENFRGQKMSAEHRWFTDVLSGAEVEHFRWHDLRHTFCSRLTMAGVGLRQVQQLARHKTIQMTAKYAHLSMDADRAALQTLAIYQQGLKSKTDTRTDTGENVLRVAS
jgi:integrase